MCEGKKNTILMRNEQNGTDKFLQELLTVKQIIQLPQIIRERQVWKRFKYICQSFLSAQ